MPSTQDSAIEAGGNRDQSGLCAALFEVATPAVYIDNAFQVSGLAVDASSTEIAARFAAHRAGAKLEQARDPKYGALDRLLSAERRLQYREYRLVDEIFWFWPLADSGSKCDPALQAVAAGDYESAKKIWRDTASHSDLGIVAIHNLAIRWHLTALHLENRWKSNNSGDQHLATLSKCWRYALRRWDLLLGDNRFWARIEQRTLALHDSAASADLVFQLRKALPRALAGINAALTLAHAESGESSLVAMHLRLIGDGSLILPAGQYSKLVFERSTKNIRESIQTAIRRRDAHPLEGMAEARNILQKLAKYEHLYVVLRCAESPAAQDLIREGLQACVDLADGSDKLTHDKVGFTALMEKMLPLAKDSKIRSLVQGNLRVASRGRFDQDFVSLDTALAALNGSGENPAQRYAAFGREVLPKLIAAAVDRPLSDEGRISALNAASRVLRTISVDAWTKGNDAITASAALQDALKYASDETLRSLYEDYKILNDILIEQGAAGRGRPTVDAKWRAGALILCALLAFAATLQLSNTVPRDSDRPSVTLRPQSTAPSIAKPTGVTGGLRVVAPTRDELDLDQRFIAEQKRIAAQLEAEYRDASSLLHERESEANNLEQQLLDQSRHLNRGRSSASDADPSVVDARQKNQDYYNTLVNQASESRAAAGALVDPLNALGERVSRQNLYVNRLLDDYDAKLKRLGK